MKYETTIHRRFESDGVPYVYSASSAAIVALDELSAAVLEHFATPGGAALETLDCSQLEVVDDAVAEQQETFEQMVALGILRPLGEVVPPAPTLPAKPFPLTTLVLNVTNKCNLSCTYCYEYGDDRIAEPKKADGTPKAPRMSVETACKSIDFLMESSGARREVTVTFFGGETLLNFEAIREAAMYARQRATECGKRVNFSLTTNATLLKDEIIDFLVEYQFGVNVSIDGGRGDHDRHRTFKSGRGSYEAIVPRIQKLLVANRGKGRPIGARVTLTAGMKEVSETYRHLTEDIGFDHVGFAPVTSSSDQDYALGDAHMGEILHEFGILADQYVEAALDNRMHGFSNINDLVQELHQGINKAHPCGAGLGLLGVSTEGELGLCHRFVESGAHEVGNINDGIDQKKRSDFLERGHIQNKVACHECFARPHCSGGCYHEAYVRYDDPAQPNLHYCEWIRAWTELGLRTYGRIANANPGFLARFDMPYRSATGPQTVPSRGENNESESKAS